MILLILFSIEAIAFEITNVHLEDGSSILEGPESGGTKVIFVTDWPTINPNNFEVFIGTSKCRIDDSRLETQVLACLTPPQPEESVSEYPIYVYYVSRFEHFGGQIPKTFKYVMEIKITDIVPREATPGDYIKIEGDFKEQDVVSKSVSGIAINPDGSLGRNIHGDLNIVLSLANTSTYPSWHLVHESINGEIYNFRTLARIDSLSHSETSTLGGLNLQITGEGFPQNPSEVLVEINKTECKVFSINYNGIECTTQRTEYLNDENFYEGGTGLLREIWRNHTKPLDQLIEKVQPDESLTIPTPQIPKDSSKNRLYGLFKPFVRAFYAFYPRNGYVKLNGKFLDYGESVFLEEESSNLIEIISENAELSVGLGTSSQNYKDGNEKPLIQHLILPIDNFKISFGQEVSSEISPYSNPEDIETLLNNEIKDFKNSLVVSSIGQGVLEFKLPSYLFKVGTLKYISAATKYTAFETLKVLAEPGDGKYWSVIPSDFLRTLEEKPQLRVWIDKVLALCRGKCNMAYIDPPVISSFYVDKQFLILQGNSLPTNDLEISITVGGEDCLLKFIGESAYKCLLQGGEGGKHQPIVRNSQFGYYEVYSKETISFDLKIESISPNVGGSKGGTYLTIEGSGFPADTERALKVATVNIGKSPCEIRSSVPYKLTCVTSAQSTDSVVTIEVNEQLATSQYFFYSDYYNLGVFDVIPRFASTLEITRITIQGSNFGSAIEDLSVKIGPYNCPIETASDTLIECKINGGSKGKYDVVVRREGYEAAWKEKFAIVFEMNSLSEKAGSLYGGTLITVSGRGFSFREEAHKVLIGRLGECEIREVVSQTTITCETLPLPETLQADTEYQVEAVGKLQELTECIGNCSFKWSYFSSPRVDSIMPPQGIAGDLITFTGEFFGDEVENVVLTFSGVRAEIQSVNHNQIVAVLPNVMEELPDLSLRILNLGNASLEIPFSNIKNVRAIEPRDISIEGGIVKVLGSGLGSGELNLDGGLVCNISESTTDYVLCELAGTCTSGCDVQFLLSRTPTITGISGDLSIAGNFLGEVDFVTLGGYPCTIQNSSLTMISCSPQVPPGSYKITVHIFGFGFASGDFTYTSALSISAMIQEYSSYAGGKLITLKGSGLHPSNTITICGSEAEIVSDDGTRIRTPALLTYFSQLSYSIEFEFPDVSQDLSKFGTNSALIALAFDGNINTSYATNGEKLIGVDAGEGKLIQLDSLSVVAGGGGRRQYRELSGTMVQASNDLTNWQTLFTFDQVDDNQNFYRPTTTTIYRAYRLFKMTESPSWAINEVEVFGAVLINTRETKYACDILITSKNGEIASLENAVIYSDSVTPVLNMISPSMGSAFGGDQVAFLGRNLGSPATVLINNVDCPVVSATEDQIICRTLPLFFYTGESLEILIEGKGYVATAGQTYLYAERWSDFRTWGGLGFPEKGESVYVYPGSTVILDTPIPYLDLIVIEGRMIVEDRPGLKIETQVLTTHYGLFQAGTEDKPFTNEFEIVLVGDSLDVMYQTFGGKTILLLSGAIDIHGIPRNPTWTFLEKSAFKNSNSITVSQDVDWKVGEEIVIAPTGYDYEEGEKRTISYIQGRTLYFDEPLKYDHYSAIEKYGDKEIDMRAEVGLLTRNIKISGDMESTIEGHGGTILMGPAVPPVEGRFSYVQLKRMGQANRILRYPLHFHLMGAVQNSYARGNSFEECYNRAIVVHGTVYSIIEDNVAYNVMGHTYFLEDGNEFKNIFRRNLAIYTKPAYNMLLSDQTPASFWYSNPDNFIDDNHAAGSYSYGFWFDQPVNPPLFVFGLAPLLLCTQYTELGSFQRNTAHSNGKSGLRISPRSVPVTTPCEPAIDRTRPDWWASNPAIPGHIDNFTSFRNKKYGIDTEDIGDIRFENIYLADNLKSGIQIGWANFSQPFQSTRIDGALIVGRSFTNNQQMKGYTGVITPQTDGMLVRNVRFYNFEEGMNPLGDSLFSDIPSFTDYGARLHKLSGFSFYNSNRKIKWNDPFRGIFEDQDGSLTGVPGAFVTPYWPHLDTEECYFDKNLDSLVCVGEKIRRVHLYSPEPIERLVHKVLTVGYKGKYSKIPMITTDEKKDIKYSWAVPFVTGHEYEVFWEDDWDALSFEIETFEGEEFVILNFNVISHRVSYSGRRGVANDDSTVLSKVPSLSSTDPAGTYSWGKDFFKIILSGVPANPNQFNDIQMIASSCCSILSSPMASSGTFRWSERSSWVENTLPEEGDSVTIVQGVTMILDVDTPILKYLEINGKLELDSERSVTLNSEIIFIRLGTLTSGGDKQLGEHVKHSIVLHGSADFHLPSIDVGDKVLINQGELTLNGHFKTTSSLLVQNALPGEDFIYLEEVTNWKVGDWIGLSASGSDTSEVEEVQISKIESRIKHDQDWDNKQYYRDFGRNRYLDKNLVTETSMQTSDYVSKIYLKTPLKFYHSGTSLKVGSKAIDMRSEVVNLERNIEIIGSVLATDGESPSKTILYGVKTFKSEQTAIRIEKVSQGSVKVKGSLILNAQNRGVLINNAKNIQFEYNALFNVKWRGIEIESSENASISNNVIVNIVNRGLTDSVTDQDAAVIVCTSPRSCLNTSVKHNRAAGYSFAGFIGPAGNCSGQEILGENLAHSGYLGWILTNDGGVCSSASNFTSTFNEQGVGSVLTVQSINLSHFSLAENKIGIAIRTGLAPTVIFGNEVVIPILQSLEDSLIIGKTQHSPQEISECRVGYYTGFGDETVSTEIELPLYASRGYSHAIGNSTLHEVSFANFGYECQFAIQSNPLVADFVLPVIISKTKLFNIPESAIIYMSNPSTYCSDTVCTGLLNVLVQDTDGSLLPKRGAILSNNPGVASKDICEFKKNNNAYFCLYDKKGYYEVLVFDEPNDIRRQYTPTTVESFDIWFKSYLGKGFYNQINFYYDFDKDDINRVRFPGIVFTGLNYNMTFYGLGRMQGRIYLQGTSQQDEAISVTVYNNYPMEGGIHVNNSVVPAVGYIYGEDRNPNLRDVHGSNKLYYEPYQLNVILRNEFVLGIQGSVNFQIALNVDYFLGAISQNPDDLYYLDVARVFSSIPSHKFKPVTPYVDAFQPPGFIPDLPPMMDF